MHHNKISLVNADSPAHLLLEGDVWLAEGFASRSRAHLLQYLRHPPPFECFFYLGNACFWTEVFTFEGAINTSCAFEATLFSAPFSGREI